MGIIRRLKWKDEKGNETEYDLGVKASNVSVDASHRFVTDKEKEEWNSKAGASDSVKENTVEFEPAADRANIVSGETLKIMMGKIYKVILDMAAVAFSGSYTDLSDTPTIPSGTAASYAVANNDTTTAAGYVADARIVRTHGLEIDQLSSDFANWFGVTADGDRGWKESGADTVIPFKSCASGTFINNVIQEINCGFVPSMIACINLNSSRRSMAIYYEGVQYYAYSNSGANESSNIVVTDSGFNVDFTDSSGWQNCNIGWFAIR